jgi:hypothetical protein
MEFFDFFEKSHFITVFILKLSLVSRPQKRKNSQKSLKISQVLPSFATFYEFKSHFEKN